MSSGFGHSAKSALGIASGLPPYKLIGSPHAGFLVIRIRALEAVFLWILETTRLYSEGECYCWSYTAVLLRFLPWASVPRVVTVRLFPSSDTTILPVVVTFVPFFTVKSNS